MPSGNPFNQSLREFAQEIKRNFRSRIPAQPEDQLKPGVQKILQAAARQAAFEGSGPMTICKTPGQ